MCRVISASDQRYWNGYANPTLSVVRRHDSKDDPRLKEPTAKTLGRAVSITKELRDLLNTYIKVHRADTKVSKTHPFIFVSHKDKEGHYQSATDHSANN